MQTQSTAGGPAVGTLEVSVKEVLRAFLLAWVGTTILSVVTFVVRGPNMWWLTIAAAVALAVACNRLRSRAGSWEGISPAFVAFLFYIVASIVLIIGVGYEWLPDPLPGLPTGDSTFFFVSPLAELLGAMIGSFTGRGSAKTEAVTSSAYERGRLSAAK